MSATGYRATRSGGAAGTGTSAARRFAVFAALAAFALLDPGAAGRSEPDDDDPDDPLEAPALAGGAFADENFDTWIFPVNFNSRIKPREYLDTLLAVRIDDIDRSCRLTEAQRQKVRLAARGQIKQFFVIYDKAWQKFQHAKNDPQKFNEVLEDVSPLRMMVQAGYFGERSFLEKSLRHTLTAEQLARYEAAVRERLTYRHRANVELVVTMLDQRVPLRASQRREIVARISELTKPARYSGDYTYYVLSYHLSQLPEESLKPLFDDFQWQVVRAQLDEFRPWKERLKQAGYWSEEQDDEKPADD
jgi:hypothetical protein